MIARKDLERLIVAWKGATSPNKWMAASILRELLDETDSLKESLAVYGGHTGGCYTGSLGDQCQCGFRKIWKDNGLQGIVDGKRAKDSKHTDLGSGGI